MTCPHLLSTYDRDCCDPLRWRVTLDAHTVEVSDPMLATLVSTPDIEVGAVVYEMCRMMIVAGDAGQPMEDLQEVLDLLVINKDGDIIQEAIEDLAVWAVDRAEDVVDLGGHLWVRETFRYVPGVPMRPEELITLLDYSREGTDESRDDLAWDGFTTTAMLAMAARALGYLCEDPSVTVSSLLTEFTEAQDEVYEWAQQ